MKRFQPDFDIDRPMPTAKDDDDVLLALGWETHLHAEPTGDGSRSYRAELLHDGELMCRISLSGTFESDATAIQALKRRLSPWIAEFGTRIGA